MIRRLSRRFPDLDVDRLLFRDFTAEEFLGGGVFNCRGPGGCVSGSKAALLLSAKWRMRAFILADGST